MADLKQVAVTIAVAVLFSVFVILVIGTAYEEPKYRNYCKDDLRYKPAPMVEPLRCDYNYDQEYNQCISDGGMPRFEYNQSGCRVYKECDFCSKAYNDASKIYSRNIFVIVGIIAVASIFGGTLWKIEFLGSGFMFAGIMLVFYATVRYFGDASKLLRILIIFVELVLVIWIGYKKLYKEQKKKKKNKKM